MSKYPDYDEYCRKEAMRLRAVAEQSCNAEDYEKAAAWFDAGEMPAAAARMRQRAKYYREVESHEAATA